MCSSLQLRAAETITAALVSLAFASGQAHHGNCRFAHYVMAGLLALIHTTLFVYGQVLNCDEGKMKDWLKDVCNLRLTQVCRFCSAHVPVGR